MKALRILILPAALLVGCGDSPTQPTKTPSLATKLAEIPEWHNMAARDQWDYELVHVCATQPRSYCDGDGNNCRKLREAYISYEPCPAVPIK